jgi:hypothetical protein
MKTLTLDDKVWLQCYADLPKEAQLAITKAVHAATSTLGDSLACGISAIALTAAMTRYHYEATNG